MRSKDIVANESGSLRVMVECNPPKRDKFTMKMHMPTTKEDTPPALTSLNLALLGLSHDDTLDSRRHPNYEDLEMIENIRWITFDFQDTADLEKFHESFKKADDERSRRDDEFAAVSSAMKAQAAKPRNGSIRTHSEVGSVLSFRSGSVSSFQSGSDRRASGYDSRR